MRNILHRVASRTILRPLANMGLHPTTGIPAACVPVNLARMGYPADMARDAALTTVADHTMLSVERLISLWEQVQYLDHSAIDGALVECGVWRGGAAGMMAAAHQSSESVRRPMHLFDSFAGLPEPNREKDGEFAIRYAGGKAEGHDRPIGRCVSALGDCRRLLEATLAYPSTLIEYHVGWFSKTIPSVAPRLDPIALLRLDGDWYESTRLALTYLYPLVVNGGLIVVDDYGYWPGCRKAVDEFLMGLQRPVLLNRVDYCARYWVKS